jgi:PPE-repeat protein
MGTQGFVAPYLAGVFETGAKAAGRGKASKPASGDSAAEETAAAAAGQAEQVRRRRRRTKVAALGRGYEYMDLDDDLGSDGGAAPKNHHAASDQGAGTLGFAGTAGKAGGEQAAGLTTLADDAFGGAPTMPMTPNTWEREAPEATE